MANVLIVDDDHIGAKALAALLQADGHSVSVANSVRKATVALGPPIEVVLLDLMLGNESGVEVLTQIKSRSLKCLVGIISGAQETHSFSTLADTVDAVFWKPIDLDRLRAWIDQSISVRRHRDYCPE